MDDDVDLCFRWCAAILFQKNTHGIAVKQQISGLDELQKPRKAEWHEPAGQHAAA